MTRHPWLWACASALVVLSLGGCGRNAEGEATSTATAPGSPGNDRVLVQPHAPDGPPGGSSGMKGSLPHTGSSGGDAVAGTTGSGTVASSQPAQAGTGLNGGLSSDPAAMGAGVATEGSGNRSSKGSVGTR